MVQRVTTPRLLNWKSRLKSEIDGRRFSEASWGDNDCGLGLTRGAFIALTGEDIPAELIGEYSDAESAFAFLQSLGYKTLAELASDYLEEHTSLLNARIGDLGIVESTGLTKDAFCIIDASFLIILTEKGIGRLPKSRLLRAFKIGENK